MEFDDQYTETQGGAIPNDIIKKVAKEATVVSRDEARTDIDDEREMAAISRDKAQAGRANVREEAAEDRSRTLHQDVARVADNLQTYTVASTSLITELRSERFWRDQFSKTKRRLIIFLAFASAVLFIAGVVFAVFLIQIRDATDIAKDAAASSERTTNLALNFLDPNSKVSKDAEEQRNREEKAAAEQRDQIIAAVDKASQDVLILVQKNENLSRDLAGSESSRRQELEETSERIRQLEIIIVDLANRLSASQQPPSTAPVRPPPSTGLCALLGELGSLPLIGCAPSP